MTDSAIGQGTNAAISQVQSLSGLPILQAKLAQRDDIAARVAALPRPLVFTNGVFDILHCGHAAYLAEARALGASLVVAINTDASARRLGKGPDRPIHNQHDRAFLLAALESVSLVTWFDENTPLEIVASIRPDFLVKGGDYQMDALPEAQLVQSYGGKALALRFVDGYSTTSLVSRIHQGAKAN